jgi:hypothetical protein
MRVIFATVVIGMIGGFLGFQLKIASDTWWLSQREATFWFWLFLTLWFIVGAIIGGTWEIVAAIKQISPPHFANQRKEGDRQT